MPIDGSIPASVKGPSFDTTGVLNLIAQSQQRRMQQESHAQEMQLGQQRIAQGELTAREAQLKMRDDQIQTQTFLQSGGDQAKHIQLMSQNGARPQAIMGIQQHYADYNKKTADTSKTDRENQAKVNELVLPLHDQALAAVQNGTIGQAWPQIYAQMDAINKETAHHFSPDQPPTAEQLTASKNAHAMQDYSIKAANEGRAQATAQQQADEAKRKADLHPLAQAEAQAKTDQITRETFAREHPEDQAAQQAALTAKDRLDKAQKDRQFNEELRSHLSNEATAKITAAVAQGRLAQEQMVNGMKYGPGTTEYWVKQLQENPDSIKEMPAELRSKVGQGFTQSTGLPLPTPLGEAGKTQETAARNALDGATFIRDAMKNPEIRKQLGPIMGRLQNAEQSVGTAVGLSPEAEKLAQELRTRMRYFVFQEGKAVLGGRLPVALMKQLEESSPSVKMDPDMLAGALNGAVGNAQSVLDNTDRQRFGGKMRSREQRGQGPKEIDVVSPEGVPGTISADRWAEAEKRGFKKK